ncbi:MAG TPA: methyltransferase domain-containing protein [Opitutaceae bacterium]|jgi:ubiquinone/menaquinone biosynthesis C-methylase UbiE
MSQPLDDIQAASAAQFDRQSDRYGKSHILADTRDVAEGLEGVRPPIDGVALDVATGGGHTALHLARDGWRVTAGDVSTRMLENARQLAAGEGFSIETRQFAAEEIPFGAASFELVTVRVAPHHFSSPPRFVREVARVLKPGGWFLLIDGTVPDNDPETDAWLNQLEKWRDPSHAKLLSRATWEGLVQGEGLAVERSELKRLKQPDLTWYFDTAGTSPENRIQVLSAIQTAAPKIRAALDLRDEDGKIVWWWPRLTLRARKPPV